MELPLGGPTLRHYTQSRPRPHRQKLNHRPSSRPQEPIIESENEAVEHMGRVDEGVEEFFTKRVFPADTLKKEDEKSPVTVQELIPASSVPCPPPSKTLRRKLGDFFTLKKRRGLKPEASHEGRSKKVSIADLIRPLREAKNKSKENDKENDKEKEKENCGTTEGITVEETPLGPLPLSTDGVPPRRALREGKSQSLILLSGSAGHGTANTRQTAKKPYDGQHSFEQKLSLMLQRIGVTKSHPGEEQNQEGEMKKADSEGTIIDNKPEPPPTFTKPRTMSTSSDTRHQIRQSTSAHESAGKPALPPKPIIKPGQQPTTSGRNTPENQLAQIQEAKTSAHSEPNRSITFSSSDVISTPTALTEPTTSTSIPHSNHVAISQPTLTPSETDVCADTVKPAATSLTDHDATSPILTESSTTSDSAAVPSPSPLSPTTTTTPTTTPTETLAPALMSSTFFESITTTSPIPPTTATITTPSITTSVSVPITESSASGMPPNPSTDSSLPLLNGTITNLTPPTTITGSSSDTATGDTASVVATSISQYVPCSATTSSVTMLTSADDVSTTQISTSSETPASTVGTPPHNTGNMSSLKTVSTDPICSESTTPSCSCPPTPTTDTDTSPASTDGVNSFPYSTSKQPDIPITSGSTYTSDPKSSTSGSTNTTHHISTLSSTTHSTPQASVHLPVTNSQDATMLSSISTSDDTVPSVAMSTAASPDDSTSTTPSKCTGQANVNDMQTPPGDKLIHETSIKAKATDESDDMVVQCSQKKETNERNQENAGKEDPHMKETLPLVHSGAVGGKVMEEIRSDADNTAGEKTGLEKTACKKDTGNEGRLEGEQGEETSSINEK